MDFNFWAPRSLMMITLFLIKFNLFVKDKQQFIVWPNDMVQWSLLSRSKRLDLTKYISDRSPFILYYIKAYLSINFFFKRHRVQICCNSSSNNSPVRMTARGTPYLRSDVTQQESKCRCNPFSSKRKNYTEVQSRSRDLCQFLFSYIAYRLRYRRWK